MSWLLNIYNISDEDNGINIGTGEVSKIKTPTLIIHGEQDLCIPLKDIEAKNKAIWRKNS